MFSKNIIVLVCVVCFIEKSSTAGKEEIIEDTSDIIADRPVEVPGERLEDDSEEMEETSDELTQPVVESSLSMLAEDEASSSTAFPNPKLDNMQTNLQWEQMFNNYDNGEKGFLSPEELQKLIYEEFRGFITIRNLKTYLHLINLKKREIRVEHLIKMSPIIAVVSKKKDNSEREENFNTNAPISKTTYLEKIAKNAQLGYLFNIEAERFEIFNLISPEVNFPIEETLFVEIEEMFEASAEADDMLESFLAIDRNKDGVITRDELYTFFKEIEPSTTKASTDNMFTPRDLNGDNLIDFGEYMTMCIEPISMLRIKPTKLARITKVLQGLNLKKKHMREINPTGKPLLNFKDFTVPRKNPNNIRKWLRKY
ncbi:uncharacterized protein LOC126838594 isoform X2 [Adelges cooleyi]|uniref:uncharacterized protein LOC126838594 isoform X2 n=1 Tax=Adelges cooleyi TaxID=133065 RepID=UPI0021800305|nr:uncharacterized protein LOC126838594 isoform X2 [Adelges cooleyi]